MCLLTDIEDTREALIRTDVLVEGHGQIQRGGQGVRTTPPPLKNHKNMVRIP